MKEQQPKSSHSYIHKKTAQATPCCKDKSRHLRNEASCRKGFALMRGLWVPNRAGRHGYGSCYSIWRRSTPTIITWITRVVVLIEKKRSAGLTSTIYKRCQTPQITGRNYELVQAYRPELCPPRMPHAKPARIVTSLFSIMLTAINSGRGWHSQFFCSGARTGAADENVSQPTAGLQKDQ